MGCKDCKDFNDYSCPDTLPSDCVTWQGNADEELEICLNDSLTYVMNIVIGKVKEFMVGHGIIFDEDDLNFDDCAFLSGYLDDEELNLITMANAYKDAICQLKTTSDATVAEMAAFTNVALYTLGCLPAEDPCGDPYTFKALIQAIITKLCALNTQFESIAETILDIVEEGAGNLIGDGAITSCGGNGYSVSGTGASTVLTLEALVPPNCPILYLGSTSLPNFDAAGIGQPGTPFCGWFLCNGDNTTPESADLPQNEDGNLNYIIRFS